MKYFKLGFTLVELLVVVSILLILGLNIPNISNTIEKNRLETALRQLNHLVQFTKISAIKNKKIITLCGSIDGKACIKDWHHAAILIFDDKNKNHQRDSDEQLYKNVSLDHNIIIEWRGSNRPYMRYDPRGFLLDWGRYTFCSKNKERSLQLVLNRAGRSYRSTINATELKKKPCNFS